MLLPEVFQIGLPFKLGRAELWALAGLANITAILYNGLSRGWAKYGFGRVLTSYMIL